MRLSSTIFTVLLFFPVMAGARQSGSEDGMPGMKMDTQSTKQASPQKKQDDNMQGMPGMDQGQMQGMRMGGNELITMHPETFLQEIVRHATSGTSAEPNSTPVPMLMAAKGAWMLMFHANVFVIDEQQSSPRGGDKFFSTNWFMKANCRRTAST